MASDELDPIVKALERSSIAQTLKAARASLAQPSRPFTPLDRSLFQTAEGGGGSRPSSSYNVDQLSFVRDTFGSGSHRPDSARSSRSSRTGVRYGTIAEEEDSYRQPRADVLRLDDERRHRRPSPQYSEGQESSGDEELTPVAAAGNSDVPLPPRTPARPPRPPGGGYPPTPGGLRTGGYPDMSAPPSADLSLKKKRSSDASPSSRKHRSDSSSRRKTVPSPSPSPSTGAGSGASASTPPGTPQRRRSSSSSKPRTADWDVTCEGVIAKLQRLADSSEEKKSAAAEELQRIADQVLDLVADIKSGAGARGQQLAPALLRAVLAVLDLKDASSLFRLCRCAFALLQIEVAVRGVPSSGVQAAYLNVAKVLFKFSKAEGNDAEFLKEDLLVPLLEVLQSSAPECTSNDLRVYVVGVLKNVAIEEANQKALLNKGAVPALFDLMAQQMTGGTKEAQLLIQITATLRSLAGKGYKQFLVENRLDLLTKIMSTFPSNVELLTNVSRVLAKLTLHGSACEMFAKNDIHIRQIARTLSANAESAPLTLRLSFVLGNLTAKSDRLRVVFAFDCEGTSLAPHLLSKYWQKERQLARLVHEKGQAKGSASQEIEEVLVKLVRLVANIAISASAGSTIASCSAAIDPLLEMLGSKSISDSEELVLNVVAAVTNLLFYDVPSNLLFQEENKTLLCRLFRPLLLESYNVEALIETARALGNLSRHVEARRCMAQIRVDEILAILLDHDDRDLVFYVCGALVNLAADPESVTRLTTVCPVLQKLGKLLVDAPADDIQLQLVAVKVLTNLSLDPGATWPASSSEDVRGALQQMIASEGAPENAEEKQQLVELAQHLLGRLPPAP
eukprot:TRINITY_DN14531_c0_g5_i1.p1 TRINITY_DN14531_c0_g5~~TRINITY_DN14531_c0_g5_i1.p1  ORF type:complete len:868 (-),score=193.45 TRINITY_DN14531_c0_g5_i1:100-2646(-)